MCVSAVQTLANLLSTWDTARASASTCKVKLYASLRHRCFLVQPRSPFTGYPRAASTFIHSSHPQQPVSGTYPPFLQRATPSPGRCESALPGSGHPSQVIHTQNVDPLRLHVIRNWPRHGRPDICGKGLLAGQTTLTVLPSLQPPIVDFVHFSARWQMPASEVVDRVWRLSVVDCEAILLDRTVH
jgi:hypothetical protein